MFFADMAFVLSFEHAASTRNPTHHFPALLRGLTGNQALRSTKQNTARLTIIDIPEPKISMYHTTEPRGRSKSWKENRKQEGRKETHY